MHLRFTCGGSCHAKHGCLEKHADDRHHRKTSVGQPFIRQAWEGSLRPEYGPLGALGGFWGLLRVHMRYILGMQGSQGKGRILEAHGFNLRSIEPLLRGLGVRIHSFQFRAMNLGSRIWGIGLLYMS